MSIVFMISKKKTNKRAVVCNRIAMRIRAVFELIVARGADAEPREHVQGNVGHHKECMPVESLASSKIVWKPKQRFDPLVHKSNLASSLLSSATPSNLRLVSNPAPIEHLIL